MCISNNSVDLRFWIESNVALKMIENGEQL